MQAQSKPLRRPAKPLNINVLDAKTLDRDIAARGWTLDTSDYIRRIQSGDILNAGLRRTANSY